LKGISGGDKIRVGQSIGPIGREASVGTIVFQQFLSELGDGQLGRLAPELAQLRESMRRAADSAEEDMSVAEISQAEVAAQAGDAATVERHLSKAGRWALTITDNIGTSLAAAALKAVLGL
jgi:hypothetical protein